MNKDEVLRLYYRYAQDVFRFAYSCLNLYYDAQDVVQDVFLKLLAKNRSVLPGKEKSYILAVTANRCRDIIRLHGAGAKDTQPATTRFKSCNDHHIKLISNTLQKRGGNWFLSFEFMVRY